MLFCIKIFLDRILQSENSHPDEQGPEADPPEENVEDVVLGPGAHGGLVHGASQQLRVPDDDVGVVDAELLTLKKIKHDLWIRIRP